MTVDTQEALQQIRLLNQQKETLEHKIHDLDKRIHELSAALCPAGQCLLPHER